MSTPTGRSYTRTKARLAIRLDELVDDGTGQIRPELIPLAEQLLRMPKPDRALNWLGNNAHLPGYLAWARQRGHRTDPRRVARPAELAHRRAPA